MYALCMSGHVCKYVHAYMGIFMHALYSYRCIHMYSLHVYLGCVHLTDSRKIKFAAMKLTGQTSQYWINLENIHASRLQRPIEMWDMMKDELKGKCATIICDCLMDKWHQYTQGNKSLSYGQVASIHSRQ